MMFCWTVYISCNNGKIVTLFCLSLVCPPTSPIWLLRIITNLPHIVYSYRLVSVQSIHDDHCSLNSIVFADIHKENWFSPLDVLKTSKENFTFFSILCLGITVYFQPIFGYHIKPPSTHFPVCRLHFSLGSVHPTSLQP